MKKFIFILILVAVALFNYKILSFSGFAKMEYDPNFATGVNDLTGQIEIQYYNNPLKSVIEADEGGNTYDYIVAISMDSGKYITKATSAEIATLKVSDATMSNVTMTKTNPVAWYFYLGGIVLILVLPMGKKKK